MADSSQPVTEYTLQSASAGTHKVLAQSENGYTMFHGKPEGKDRMVLCPTGSVPLLNDSAAQICVMGKNFMYTLADVGPPPATLRVYGAGNCILPLHGVGYLTLSFNSANFENFDIASFQRASVQGVHVAAHRFQVHMLSAVEGSEVRGRASRNGRGEGKGCAGRPQAAAVTKLANPWSQ